MAEFKAHEAVSEHTHDPDLNAYQRSLDTQERLLKEIDDLLRDAPDRGAAERTIVSQYAARIEEAANAAHRAFEAWLKKTVKDNP